MTSLETIQVGERLILGSFFLISGGHKLFVADVHRRVVGLFRSVGFGNRFVEWSVPGGEFLGGLALLVGFLVPLASIGLIIILIGAIYLDVWKSDVVDKHPRDALDWVAKTLYCSEVQMLFILMSLVLLGSGPFSVDRFLF